MLPNAYVDLNDLSLIKVPNSVPELYIELWWYSGSSSLENGNFTSAGQAFVQKGSTGYATSSSFSSTKLHTLNSNWPSSFKYAFEAAIKSPGGTAALWDITAGAIVSASQITTTTSTDFTTFRSGQFTLTPGHVYGITYWTGSSANTINLTDASLIVFPN